MSWSGEDKAVQESPSAATAAAPWADYQKTDPAAAAVETKKNVSREKVSAGKAFMTGAKQGSTYGFYDEMMASEESGKKTLKDLRNDYANARSDSPKMTMAGEAVGAIGTTLAGAYLGSKAVSGFSGALSTFAKASPTAALSLSGAGSGALYGAGTGEGTLGDRAISASVGGTIGAFTGPLVPWATRSVAAPVAKGIGALAGGALKMFKKPAAVAPAAKLIVQDTFSDITEKPLQLSENSSVTGKVRLPTGVRKKDVELLRVEENARQGLLGTEAQKRIQEIDAGMNDDVRNVMQSLMGKNVGSSRDILVKSIETFRSAATSAKKRAATLADTRDAMMAETVFNKKALAPSLGKALNDVTTNPKYIASMKSDSGAPAKALYDKFITLMKTTDGNELPYHDLEAWRRDVSHLQGTDFSTAGHIAKQLGEAYDDWMGDISEKVILKGNPEAPKVAQAARQAFRQYYKLYDPETRIGGAAVLGQITKQYEKTPEQFIQGVFSDSLRGNNNTTQIVQGMLKGVSEAARPAMKHDIFSGLMARAFEVSTKPGKNMFPSLRNSLNEIISGDTYKKVLSTPERDAVIKNLMGELDAYVSQTGRADVRSPSAGHMARIVGAIGKIPGAGKITFGLSGLAQKGAESITATEERAALQKSMREYAKQFSSTAKASKLKDRIFSAEEFDLITPQTAGTAGGAIGGASSNFTVGKEEQ